MYDFIMTPLQQHTPLIAPQGREREPFSRTRTGHVVKDLFNVGVGFGIAKLAYDGMGRLADTIARNNSQADALNGFLHRAPETQQVDTTQLSLFMAAGVISIGIPMVWGAVNLLWQLPRDLLISKTWLNNN